MSSDPNNWSPTAVHEITSGGVCDDGDCNAQADWEIEYNVKTPDGLRVGTFEFCDGHIEEYWGYHPSDNGGKTDVDE